MFGGSVENQQKATSGVRSPLKKSNCKIFQLFLDKFAMVLGHIKALIIKSLSSQRFHADETF